MNIASRHTETTAASTIAHVAPASRFFTDGLLNGAATHFVVTPTLASRTARQQPVNPRSAFGLGANPGVRAAGTEAWTGLAPRFDEAHDLPRRDLVAGVLARAHMTVASRRPGRERRRVAMR